MGRGKLALFSQDERYAAAFAEYCGKNEKERITVKSFTNNESLEHCLKTESIDILLTEVPLEKLGITQRPRQVVLLSEEKYVESSDGMIIYKFQRMDYILKEIYRILADDSSLARRNSICITGRKGPDIICCYSPCYEETREQYARTLAEYKGRAGRTLFINFAMFTAYDNEGEDGLSELLYYSSGEEGAIEYKLPTLVKYISGYESLPGVKNYLDLCDLDKNIVINLFDKLRMLSEYKTIIVDIGVTGDLADSIMEYGGRLLMPVPGEADRRRLEHMRSDHINGAGEDVMGRIKEFKLPLWWCDRPERRIKWVSEQYA